MIATHSDYATACSARRGARISKRKILLSNHKKTKYRDVAQMVARLLWEQDVAGSNPVIPTISSVHNESDEHSIFFCLYLIVWSRNSALFLLLCRGWQILHRNALSALKGDLALSVPFGDLQTTNEAVMDNNSLCAILTCSFDLINFDLFDKLTKDHRIERFHLHKAPHRFEKVIL